MKIHIKIYNKEVIDCSSCHNTVYPDPESSELLLDILQGVCESDAVLVIGEFSVLINDILLQTPKIDVNNYSKPNYVLQSGKEAETNRIAKLYIEPEQESRERLRIPEHSFIRESHYIEPGLQGVQKGIRYIKSLFKSDRETLPEYLKDEILKKFVVSIEVIWKMDKWKMGENFKGNYDHIDSERDLITAISTSSEIKFFFSNNDNYMIYASKYYLGHLNTIQRVLEQVAPGMYEADPMNREDLLEIGYLKRENRMHIIPNEEERKELEINEREFYQNKNR